MHDFSVLLGTCSNLADINRFLSHTEKLFIAYFKNNPSLVEKVNFTQTKQNKNLLKWSMSLRLELC